MIPTIVGLIIALTIISQNGMLIESYKEEIFDQVVFDPYTQSYGDIRTSFSPDSDQDGSIFDYPKFFTNFSVLDQLQNTSLRQADYTDYIQERFWYSEVMMEVLVNRTIEMGIKRINTHVCSSSKFYDQLEDILAMEGTGRLPENSSEILLLRPALESGYYVDEEFDNLTLNTEINITLPKAWGSSGSFRNNKTVRIAGILELTSYWYKSINDYFSNGVSIDDITNVTMLARNYIEAYNWDYSFLTFPSFLHETLDELAINHSGIYWNGQVRGKMFVNSKKYDVFNINAEKTKLNKLILSLDDSLVNYLFNGYSYVESDLLYRMQAYETTLLGLLIMLLLISFPVIFIALYLVVYSFGLIRRQKQKQIGIIKTRGGSWFQVFTVLTGEMIISTIIAVMIGFILSIFLSDIVMRSTDYLEFIGNPIPVKFSISMFKNLIFWGLIIALFLNFTRIIRMSRQKITETLIPVETRNPLWKRYYFDVIIFIIGTGSWLLLMTLIRISYNTEITEGTALIYMIVSLLGIPAPFLIFFGTIMVIARFFPFLMQKLSEFLWRIEGGINAFAIRNIVRHKQAANRAVLLITLAISFSILASSLIFSLDETAHVGMYYDSGADITLDYGTSPQNDTIIKLLKENVTDITHVSCMYSGGFHSVFRSYHFLFLDPNTYAQTAFFKSCFKLSSSLNNLMTQISDNQTIILFDGNLKSDVSKPRIGDNISIRFSNGTTNEIRSLKIGGTFKLWPMMYPDEWKDFSSEYWLVGSIGMFQELSQSNYLDYPNGKYLVKLDTYADVEQKLEKIYNLTSITPNSPVLNYLQYKDSFERHFSLSILNSNLIICITVSVVGVIMFAFFTYVERGKEIGVERALGMTQFQTAVSFLVEASTILAFGTVIGYFTGTYFVTMFLQITQIGVSIPPMVVTYPIPLLMQIMLVILIVAAIGTILPAYMATRKDISRILKVE